MSVGLRWEEEDGPLQDLAPILIPNPDTAFTNALHSFLHLTPHFLPTPDIPSHTSHPCDASLTSQGLPSESMTLLQGESALLRALHFPLNVPPRPLRSRGYV